MPASSRTPLFYTPRTAMCRLVAQLSGISREGSARHVLSSQTSYLTSHQCAKCVTEGYSDENQQPLRVSCTGFRDDHCVDLDRSRATRAGAYDCRRIHGHCHLQHRSGLHGPRQCYRVHTPRESAEDSLPLCASDATRLGFSTLTDGQLSKLQIRRQRGVSRGARSPAVDRPAFNDVCFSSGWNAPSSTTGSTRERWGGVHLSGRRNACGNAEKDASREYLFSRD